MIDAADNPGSRRRATLWVAAAMLAALTASAGDARAVTFGDIDIDYETPPDAATLHGYAEYPFRIQNTSTTDTHTVTIFLPRSSGGGYGGGDRLSRVSKTVTVGPGAIVRMSLLQPPLPVSGSGVGVAVDGRVQQAPLDNRGFAHLTDTYSRTYGGSVHPPSVLVAQSLNVTDLENTFDALYGSSTTTTYGYSARTREFMRTQRPLAIWPEHWLAYTRYDGVMIAADDFRQLSDGARLAVRGYIEGGGALVVVGDWEPPASWRRDMLEQGAVTSHYLGFGQVCVVPEKNVGSWNRGVWTPVRDALVKTGRPWLKRYDVQDANRMFPVVEELGVPVRGLFVLMLVFATLIGPVNLFVLARMKRKIWLLWTVPAISLFACVSVFSYNLLAEGFTGSSRTQGITLLDQGSKRAATIGWTAFYSPLTPGGGLHFSQDTEVTPQTGYENYDDGRPRTVDWTHDQHLDDGWVTARVPAHFMVRKVVTARERLDFGKAGTDLTVTNGLGVDISKLLYMDRDGNTYMADDVAAGQKVKLWESTVSGSRRVNEMRHAYASEWLGTARRMTDSPQSYLRPGTYIAIVPASPFIETALSSTEIKQVDSIIYGVLE